MFTKRDGGAAPPRRRHPDGTIGRYGSGAMSEERELPAGDFASWVVGMRDAIRSGGESVVPCGGCTACCTSSQFVHVAPDEAETIARIPAELLVPAPGLPEGHLVLGYDERGHCPLLVDGRCSIYEHRPRACRTYDCRVFPAAGLGPDGTGALARRARRWRFGFPAAEDHERRRAVRAAAAHLATLPEGERPATTTEHAVRAVELHERFVRKL
jgi:Fe-S-cluster containining protein